MFGIKYQHIPNTLHYEHENTQVELLSTCDIAHSFAKYFQSNSSNSNFDNDFAIYRKAKGESFNINSYIHSNNNEYNLPLTIRELHSELRNCTSKSPGFVDISYTFIKSLSEFALIKILTIYNLIWAHGILPIKWRHAIVIPILKADKNKFEINSYRPISLTCTLCKLLEKMVNKRLVWYLETSHKFIKQQYGFRRYHSTQDFLATLHTHISKSIKKNNTPSLTPLTWKKLMIWSGKIETIQVKVNNIFSEHTAIENGLPHGSIISVTLFLVAINAIFSDIQKPMKIIKTLSHLTWGAEKDSLLLIYKALILSRIDYGFIIYNSAKPNIKQILNPIHNQAIRLAIDASKNINGAGSVFISGAFKRLFKLPTETSIFTAEIVAIKEAIIYAESIPINKALIISDSLSALTSLLSINPSNEISQQILNITSELNNIIEFMWVPILILALLGMKNDLLANQAISSLESTEIKSLLYKDLLRIGNKIAL
ncbi:Uncharacterized protein FWK35_00034389 [Aphis craccivora]|uniref:Reverse transcriptase domain-containing protein n=1 Tax=Aphis craccivora TaxID=307492 RepID=A0A6G0W1P5_APHCR|nr:Uncharacterized protein FWK35_00034389 [Aphis craccivora]